MAKLLEEPLLVSLVDRTDFHCEQGGVYVFGSSAEQRSAIDEVWQERQISRGTEFIEITSQGTDSVSYLSTSGTRGTLELTSKSQAVDLISCNPPRTLYLDITGLSHHVWAPLVRAGVASDIPFFVIYMEPKAYRLRKHPQRGAFYDLSDRTEGNSTSTDFCSSPPRPLPESNPGSAPGVRRSSIRTCDAACRTSSRPDLPRRRCPRVSG